LRMATKTVRFQLLTWIGIVGGAVTIFSNLRGLLSLATWARWLVTHWQDLIQAFWATLFGWVGLRMPPLLIPMLSFAVFVAMIIVGVALRTAGADQSEAKQARPENRFRRLRRFLVWSVGYVVFVSVLYLGLVAALRYELIGDSLANALPAFGVLAPMIALVLASNEKLQSALMIVIVFVLLGLVVVFPMIDVLIDATRRMNPQEFAVYASSELFLAMTVLAVIPPLYAIAIATLAPVRLVNQRLLFLSLGVIVLIALNGISLLDLHRFLDAPK
jgi:hypothetical protein